VPDTGPAILTLVSGWQMVIRCVRVIVAQPLLTVTVIILVPPTVQLKTAVWLTPSDALTRSFSLACQV